MATKLIIELDDQTESGFKEIEESGKKSLDAVAKAAKRAEDAMKKAETEAEKLARQQKNAADSARENTLRVADEITKAAQGASHLGENLTKAFGGSEQQAANVATAINTVSTGLQSVDVGVKTVIALNNAMKASSAAANAAALSNTAVATSNTAVATSGTAAAGAMTALGAALAANPIGAALVAITGAAAAAGLAYSFFSETKPEIEEHTEKLGGVSTGMANLEVAVRDTKAAYEELEATQKRIANFAEKAAVQDEIDQINKAGGFDEINAKIQQYQKQSETTAQKLVEANKLQEDATKALATIQGILADKAKLTAEQIKDATETEIKYTRELEIAKKRLVDVESDHHDSIRLIEAALKRRREIEQELERIKQKATQEEKDAAISEIASLQEIQRLLEEQEAAKKKLADSGQILGEKWHEIERTIKVLTDRFKTLSDEQKKAAEDQAKAAEDQAAKDKAAQDAKAKADEEARKKAEDAAARAAQNAKDAATKSMGGAAQNVVQAALADQKALARQVAENRVKASGLDPDSSDDPRERAKIRAQIDQIKAKARFDVKTGAVSPEEGAQATKDLSDKLIENAKARGQLDEQTAEALSLATEALIDQIQKQRDLAEQVQSIQGQLNNATNGRNRAQNSSTTRR